MQFGPWNGFRETVSPYRLFEYTDDALAASFKDGDRPLLDKLIRDLLQIEWVK
jgi:hypothetical protein